MANDRNLEVMKKSEFLGTERRKKAMDVIMQICRENNPCPYKELVNILSYKTGLTTRKIEEDYLEVLISVRMLQLNKNLVEVGAMDGK